MSYPTHKSHWISEGTVRTFALAILGVLALAIAGFAPVVAEEPGSSHRSAEISMGQHIVNITTRPSPGGQILIEAEVRTPDGTLVSSPRIMAMAGEPVEVSTTVGGKQYKLSITPAADGSGFAKLEVLEGDEVVDTIVKSLQAPSERLRRPAEEITVSLRDADLREFAAMVSRLTGVNVHVASAAQGRVTIEAKKVPWDKAVADAVAPLGLALVFGNGDAHIVPRDAVVPGRSRSPFASPAPPPHGYERVGGDVKTPQVLTRVDPIYPEAARKDRVQGIVMIEALIGEDGLMREVKVLKGLPMGLDQAAADAVRQWTFLPATKDGKPVAVVFNLTINFKLDGKETNEP